MCALPLVVGINKGGHYFRYFSSSFGPSVLRATSGSAEQLRETTIFGIFPLLAAAAGVTLLAFTPEGIVVGF